MNDISTKTSNVKVKGYRLEQDKKRTIPGTFASLLNGIFWAVFILFCFILGISLIIDSLYFINDYGNAVDDYSWLIGFSVTALVYFFLFATKYTNVYIRIGLAILTFLITFLIMQVFGRYVLIVFHYVAGAIVVIMGILILLDAVRKFRDHVNFLSGLGTLLLSAIYITIGVASLVWSDGLWFLTLFFGVYLTLLSANIMWQFFTAGTRLDRIRKVKKIITFPTIFSSFLTIGFFKRIKRIAKENKLNEISEKSHGALDAKKTDAQKSHEDRPDMTIFIHIKDGLISGVGHVDFAFDGKVYCYGEYDEEAQYFNGLYRDGVLAVMDPRQHVKRAVGGEEKLLVAYELKLTQKQKERVRRKIQKIMSEAYPWQSKAELAANHLLPGKPMDYMDNASALYNLSNAKTYKFSKGSDYKTYYLLGQNCSIVANDMITETGIRLRKLNGMITPGTYLNFMEELYKMPNSIVKNRILFRGEDVDIKDESEKVEEESSEN